MLADRGVACSARWSAPACTDPLATMAQDTGDSLDVEHGDHLQRSYIVRKGIRLSWTVGGLTMER